LQNYPGAIGLEVVQPLLLQGSREFFKEGHYLYHSSLVAKEAIERSPPLLAND
jgi:hypothetical protein